MNLSLATMIAFGRDAILNPREAARWTMGAGLTSRERWMAFAVVVLLSVIVAHLFLFVAVPGAISHGGGALFGPLGTLVLQGVVLLVITVGITIIGRAFGGKGRFSDALILISLLQALLVGLQVLQLGVFLVLPPLSTLMGWGAVVLMLWLLTNFTAELHGFRSLPSVAIGMVASFFVLAIVMGFVLLLLGVQLTPVEGI